MPATIETSSVIAIAALAVTFAGIIFQAGKLTARIEALENWRLDVMKAFDGIHAAIREVRDVVKPPLNANEHGGFFHTP